MPNITDFIKSIIAQRPLDAKEQFDEIMSDVLADKIDQEYDTYKQNFFGVKEVELEDGDDQ